MAATEIRLTLDGDALREATVQAMMGVLTPEARAAIIEKAIQALLAPSTSSYDRGKSPIQIAFDAAIDRVACATALKMVTEDGPLSQRIAELMRETADKVLAMDTGKLSTRMADAFVSSMRRD